MINNQNLWYKIKVGTVSHCQQRTRVGDSHIAQQQAEVEIMRKMKYTIFTRYIFEITKRRTERENNNWMNYCNPYVNVINKSESMHFIYHSLPSKCIL